MGGRKLRIGEDRPSARLPGPIHHVRLDPAALDQVEVGTEPEPQALELVDDRVAASQVGGLSKRSPRLCSRSSASANSSSFRT